MDMSSGGERNFITSEGQVGQSDQSDSIPPTEGERSVVDVSDDHHRTSASSSISGVIEEQDGDCPKRRRVILGGRWSNSWGESRPEASEASGESETGTEEDPVDGEGREAGIEGTLPSDVSPSVLGHDQQEGGTSDDAAEEVQLVPIEVQVEDDWSGHEEVIAVSGWSVTAAGVQRASEQRPLRGAHLSFQCRFQGVPGSYEVTLPNLHAP